MGLRTGSSTAERGAWPRSLRGTIVAGPTPSRAHDNDCLCLPAASTSHQSEAGKKESPDHHLNPACQPCAEPSSISSFDCRLINARTADNGSAQNGSTNKSAKVVLVFISQARNEPNASAANSGTVIMDCCGASRISADGVSTAASLVCSLEEPSRIWKIG